MYVVHFENQLRYIHKKTVQYLQIWLSKFGSKTIQKSQKLTHKYSEGKSLLGLVSWNA